MLMQNLPQSKAVWLGIAISACVILLFGIFWLGYNVKDMNQQGIKCLSNPIGYAGYLFQTQGRENVLCQCVDDSRINYNGFKVTLNYSNQS